MSEDEPHVAIFWDLESCSIPKKCDVAAVVQRIKGAGERYGRVMEFVAHLSHEMPSAVKAAERDRQSGRTWSKFDSLGVKVEYTRRHGQAEVVDRRIIVDVLVYIGDHPKTSLVIIITDDTDFMNLGSRVLEIGVGVAFIASFQSFEKFKRSFYDVYHWKDDVLNQAGVPWPPLPLADAEPDEELAYYWDDGRGYDGWCQRGDTDWDSDNVEEETEERALVSERSGLCKYSESGSSTSSPNNLNLPRSGGDSESSSSESGTSAVTSRPAQSKGKQRDSSPEPRSSSSGTKNKKEIIKPTPRNADSSSSESSGSEMESSDSDSTDSRTETKQPVSLSRKQMSSSSESTSSSESEAEKRVVHSNTCRKSVPSEESSSSDSDTGGGKQISGKSSHATVSAQSPGSPSMMNPTGTKLSKGSGLPSLTRGYKKGSPAKTVRRKVDSKKSMSSESGTHSETSDSSSTDSGAKAKPLEWKKPPSMRSRNPAVTNYQSSSSSESEGQTKRIAALRSKNALHASGSKQRSISVSSSDSSSGSSDEGEKVAGLFKSYEKGSAQAPQAQGKESFGKDDQEAMEVDETQIACDADVLRPLGIPSRQPKAYRNQSTMTDVVCPGRSAPTVEWRLGSQLSIYQSTSRKVEDEDEEWGRRYTTSMWEQRRAAILGLRQGSKRKAPTAERSCPPLASRASRLAKRRRHGIFGGSDSSPEE